MTDTSTATAPPPRSRASDEARTAGPVLVWFAVLGGFLAWGLHLLLAWMVTEVTCTQGASTVGGLGLRWVAALATALPGIVALGAFAVALRAGRTLARADRGDPRLSRARFLVRIGAWLDALSLLMIAFGAVAVATLPVCGTTGRSVALAALVPSGGPGRSAVLVTGLGAHGGAGTTDDPGPASLALVGVLALWLVAHLVGTARCAGRRPSLRTGLRRVGLPATLALVGGLAALALALGPWAEPLADRSLAAHMGQHMLLLVVAAPLLAAAAPGTPLVLLLPVRARRQAARARHRLRTEPVLRQVMSPAGAWLLSVATLWLWHLPPLYEAALGSGVLHAAEHACFLVGAWAFWWYVLHEGPARVRGGAAVLFVFAATLPAAALGAVLTFAGAPLYPTQAAGAVRAGLDPLHDQQLAGLVMWVPPDVAYLVVTAALVLPWLARLAGPEVDDPPGPVPLPVETPPTSRTSNAGRRETRRVARHGAYEVGEEVS
jgi:cytochrome c oxidase assembly factor CtaG